MLNHIDLMAALTADYLNVYVMRPNEDSADVVKLQGYVTPGITKDVQNFTYSKLLRTYAEERVYSEDREYFLRMLSCESLLKTFQDGRDRLDCDYRVEENGQTHYYSVRYSRISEPEEDLRLVVAFKNIDSIINVGEEQHKRGLYNAYNAISGIFFSLHRVDVKNNTYASIKTTPSIDKVTIAGSDNYDDNSKRIITALSSDWSVEEALRFVDRSTLKERMAGKNHIMMEFLSYAAESCRLHFLVEDKDENGELYHVIFAVEKVDEEKSQAIINVLSRDYQNVFWINLEDGSARILKMKKPISDDVNESENRRFMYGEICEDYIANSVHPDDRKRLEDSISLESLREVFRDKDELSGSYRAYTNGQLHHYRYSYFKLANLNSVVTGFRNIDDLIAQHEVEEKAQREAELAHQKRMEEQLAIFNTLSRNFKNIYMVSLEDGTAKTLKLEDKYAHSHFEKEIMGEAFPYEIYLNEWIEATVHPDDKDSLRQRLSLSHIKGVFATRDEYKGNYRIVKEGKTLTFQFNISLMEDKKHLLAGFQHIDDIISMHLAEEDIRRKKEKAYQDRIKEQLKIFDTLTKGFKNVYLADMDKETIKILKLSEGYKDLLDMGEYPEMPFDSVRKNWIETIVCPEDRDEMRKIFETENVRNQLETKGELSGSYRSNFNGETHHYQYIMNRVDLPGMRAVLGYQNVDEIVEEHIEQERRERELREARLREAQEHTEVISALSTIYSTIFRADVDTHDYEILTSVPLMGTVARTTGNFDDVKEQIISAFMAPEDQAPMREFLDLDTLPDRLEKINTITTEYKDPSGEWFKSRFIVKRRDENGVVKEILYVCRNNTDEKTKELEQQDQLAHALMAAQQANKAKSTFLNSMSHDIRTPMNAIIGFTALAQTHMDDSSQVQDYLAKISTSSTHLLSLINDVLDMSRIESGTVKLDERPVHIPDLLHDLRTMIQGLTNSKNQNLYIDTQDVLHEDVIADRLRLNQVLINIVGNAVKYTQPGGDIIIRLLEKPSAKQHYRTYEFSVKDTGIGMTKEFKEHIFESFSRERNSTTSGIQGTGLGMAITKNIVDLMGGEITVESEEGKGSTFTVVLDLKLASEPVQRDPIPALKGARVLVADDDLNTCKSVSQMLRDIEMRPDWTASGREAVIRAQEAAEIKDEYKVYIIDYLMPDMNGVETVRRIRRVISEDVPIIVLTAYDWSDFEAEAREAGVTAFVAKPLFMSELRSVLANPSGKGENKDKKTKNYDYSGKHVLLVEDNELNREIATAILEDVNMKVDTAVDGAEAVEIMHKADENEYDLIFMDIQMPKMDGYTATREIRTLTNNRKANIPIVAMTANAFEEDKIKSLEAGMNAHISKPISMEAIADVLDSIFAGRA